MMELSETIELMQSGDYKERFKAEYWQTRIRYEELCEIIQKCLDGTLEFELESNVYELKMQLHVMYLYIYVLEGRADIEGIDLSEGINLNE